MNANFYQDLKALLSPRAMLLRDEPLAPVTSFRIGGPAEFLLIPGTVDDVQQAVALASRHELPWRMLGSGSNILVPDDGLPGLTIKFWRNLNEITVTPPRVTAQAGADMLSLSRTAAEAGLSGLEWACGIPGTVGGAVYMNAGVKAEEIRNTLLSAEVLLQDGEIQTLTNEELLFSYRSSALQSNSWVLLAATFSLEPAKQQEIYEKMNAHLSLRSNSQPINLPNCGSVFRNPKGDYAGRLIEAAGLKGYRQGGVQVSEQHANFIVNLGSGTAQDVSTLIRHIQTTVKQKFDVDLREEIRMIQ